MSARLLALATALAAAANLGAQGGARPAPRALQAPPSLCAAFGVAAATVQELAAPAEPPAGPFTVLVELGGAPRVLVLRPYELRAAGYALLDAGAQGARSLPLSPCPTFRGWLEDDAGSVAAAGFVGGALHALVRRGDGSVVAIQPVRAVVPTAGPSLYCVFRAQDQNPSPWRCGVTAQPAARPGRRPPSAGPDALFTCELACEADHPFVQMHGGNAVQAQNDVLAVVNAVDAIYLNDLQIRHVVTTVLARTAPDPYTTSDPSALLSEFQTHWNGTQAPIQRDVAHLFTGRNMAGASGGVIGIAYISAVCNLAGGYAVSQSLFTQNLVQRTGLTAHELGHNWGSGHCDVVPDCRIMCPWLGGCAGNLGSFGPWERGQIEPFRDRAPCLQVQTTLPQVTSVQPASVTSYRPQPVTIDGTGFVGASQVDVGAHALQPGAFAFVDDRTIRFAPPQGLPPGSHPVRVVNPSGASNAAPFAYAATSPPALDVPAGAFGGLSAPFAFGGLPGNRYYVLTALQNLTAPVQGWPLLQQSSVLALGTLDAGGIGGFAVPVPAGVLHGLTVYSQLLDVDPATMSLAGTSAVQTTRIFF